MEGDDGYFMEGVLYNIREKKSPLKLWFRLDASSGTLSY